MMPRSDDRLLLNAALDGELDAVAMIEIERRLAAEPLLAAEYARLRALKAAVAAHAADEAAPDRLRARMAALAHPDRSDAAAARTAVPSRLAAPRAMSLRWAAALAASVVIAIGSYAVLVPNEPDAAVQAIVAGYKRAQISGRPIDVASSDRHTVKPWLAGKAPLATSVVDLAAEGYPLAGGRIDIVSGNAVPTLVYQRREHFISVTELATPPAAAVARRETVDGFSVERWSDGERAYAAVSDMPPGELQAFVAVFRRAVAHERESDGTPGR